LQEVDAFCALFQGMKPVINNNIKASASGQGPYNQKGNIGIGHNSGTVSDSATAAGIANEKDPP